jgi:hypothetical protein
MAALTPDNGKLADYLGRLDTDTIPAEQSISIIDNLPRNAKPILISILGADVSNSAADVLADVTGLSFPVLAGNRYWFKFSIVYDAAATTTGSRWTINGPATTSLAYRSRYALTATTETVNNVGTYNSPAASNAFSAATSGNTACIEGFVDASASGNVIARFASGVLTSAITAKAGSSVQYRRL